MPRNDGTGPMGSGSMTGRGLGVCTEENVVRYGFGRGLGLRLGRGCRGGYGRGFGWYFMGDKNNSKAQKELLKEEKHLLSSRLDVINKQLEELE